MVSNWMHSLCQKIWENNNNNNKISHNREAPCEQSNNLDRYGDWNVLKGKDWADWSMIGHWSFGGGWSNGITWGSFEEERRWLYQGTRIKLSRLSMYACQGGPWSCLSIWLLLTWRVICSSGGLFCCWKMFLRARQSVVWTWSPFLCPLIELAGPWAVMEFMFFVEASQFTLSFPCCNL